MKEVPLSDVPDFTCAGAVWRCWVEPDGVNEIGLPAVRLVWRSSDGRCAVGRNVGSDTCWAAVDGRIVGDRFVSVRNKLTGKMVLASKRAMLAATNALERRAAS